MNLKTLLKALLLLLLLLLILLTLIFPELVLFLDVDFNNDEGFSVGPVLFKGSGNVLDEFKFTLALLLDGNLGIELKGVTVAPDSA